MTRDVPDRHDGHVSRTQIQSATRLLVGGVVLSVATLAAGYFLTRARLGATDEAALVRVEQEVRTTFAQESSQLTELTDRIAARRGLFVSPPVSETALQALFEAADDALRNGRSKDLAVSIFDGHQAPLAWSGRPSELPADRVAGPTALFVAPGPLGPRLVYVQPVLDRERLLATVAAERSLGIAAGPAAESSEGFTVSTTLAPVLLRTRYEGAGEGRPRGTFLLTSPSGEALLEARVSQNDLAQTRTLWHRRAVSLALVVLVLTLLLCTSRLVELWQGARTRRSYLIASGVLLAGILGMRLLLWLAGPPDIATWTVFASATYSSSIFPAAFRSPADFLLTSAMLAAIVALTAGALERRRLALHHAVIGSRMSVSVHALKHLAAGAVVAALILGYQRFLDDTLARSSVDVLHFSIHPWDPGRLSLDVGLILFHAAVTWAGVLLLRFASTPHPQSRLAKPAWLCTLWLLPTLVTLIVVRRIQAHVPIGPAAVAVATTIALVWLTRYMQPRLRHASQAMRLVAGLIALVIPALAMYPTLLHFALDAKRRLIETRLAPEAARLRDDLSLRLGHATAQVDGMHDLGDLVEAADASSDGAVATDTAYAVWTRSDLGRYRLTSAVELYGKDGALVSRFALNLPEDTSIPQRWRPQSCDWSALEESVPVGAEDRRVLRAGRLICDATGRQSGAAGARGAIALHVMLDYNALPFISSQSPYFELFRSDSALQEEAVPGRDVEFVVYGWGRLPIHTSAAAAWTIDDRLFDRIARSRGAFWTDIDRGDRRYAVYFTNDRAGIFALGYPLITWPGHLVNLAELTTLAALGYALYLCGAWAIGMMTSHRPASGSSLLREIRSSFYRRLFLAFVAASVVPVLILAFVTRAYIAGQLRDGIDAAAVRSADVARRVVERYVDLQQRAGSGLPAVSDDVLVGLSAVIDQHVDIFDGPYLMATSERDLFASGLLPVRTPGSVYRAVTLEHRATFVGDEAIGPFRYLLAASPVDTGRRGTILTVPLTLRQQEIEREIDELDRRVLLAALSFILLGAIVGYSMAERIADPVSRLTRATRRIARGDLDARIALKSADELGRLVEAFNSMAADLARQRSQVERTHRLEAWAEMARQVAHDIKNPLTPIQLSAEHLVRVHADRGRPLEPILEECVNAILGQVRLLRQISGEFSSFAASPTPRLVPTAAADLVEDVVRPYRAGLADRIHLTIDVPPTLPSVDVDRMLLSRALANIIENALNAMPNGGELSIRGAEDKILHQVTLVLTDNGPGMSPDAVSRAFEPYFSTKVSGTGLGLAIAKRNIEACGGSIAIESQQGRGTSVRIVLPAAV
jgi:signal transduction histidine kinase